MAIKTCPECGAQVENSQICPKCGYSLKRKVNMANVNASLDAIARYDKRTSLLLLLLIPSILFVVLAFFTKPFLLVLGFIFSIIWAILTVIATLNRPKFILSVCTDKYSLISFIKEQNQNTASLLRDAAKLTAAAVAISFTLEDNPTAKKLFRKFAIIDAFVKPLLLISMFVVAFPLTLGNCTAIDSPLLHIMDSPKTVFVLIPALIVLVLVVITQSKFNKAMPVYVDEWLKKQDNIDEEEAMEAIPVASTEVTSSQSSVEDEFDLSNFDL